MHVSGRCMAERTRSAGEGHFDDVKREVGGKNVVCTYVSLSSHDRHVSFTVPCKTEADGGISVRNLYVFFFFKEVRSAGHVGTTIHVTFNSLPTDQLPTFPATLPHSAHAQA